MHSSGESDRCPDGGRGGERPNTLKCDALLRLVMTFELSRSHLTF